MSTQPLNPEDVARRLAEQRAAFESWVSSPPRSQNVYRFPADERHTFFPGQYRTYSVQLAWEAWQAAQAEVPADPNRARLAIEWADKRIAAIAAGGRYVAAINAGDRASAVEVDQASADEFAARQAYASQYPAVSPGSPETVAPEASSPLKGGSPAAVASRTPAAEADPKGGRA